MNLYVQRMVSLPCKIVVKDIMERFGLHIRSMELGEIELEEESITTELREKLRAELLKSGLDLTEDKKAILTDRITRVIVEMIHYSDQLPQKKYSVYISNRLKLDYNYLSNIFSEMKGTTIDRFIIANKIEKVKELLTYNDLSIKEISYRMNYSSVAHLSNQFKKITGLTPSTYKKQKIKSRTPIEDL